MGRAMIWCEFVCRQCAAHICGQFAGARLPRRELQRVAKRQKAIFAHNEVFCCAACKQRFETEREEALQGADA